MTDERTDDGFDPSVADDVARLAPIIAAIAPDDRVLESPPAELWERLAGAASVAPASGPGAADVAAEPAEAHPPAPGAGPRLVALPPAGAPPSTAGTGPHPGEGVPVRRSGRPLPRTVGWVLAAAAVVVVAGLAWLVAGDDADPPVVATAQLDALVEEVQPTSATLVRSGDGLEVRLDAPALDVDGGFAEVWLLGADGTELVSLGPVRPDGSYRVPDGVGVAQYPLVDVSREAVDGDPGHSGDSVLRGQWVD